MDGPLANAFAAARQTNAAHASALDALERAFDAEMAQLARDRRAVEDDRAAFIKDAEQKLARDEAEQDRMRAAAPPPGDVVKLNVGGARFETSRAVLTCVEDSMLGRMFGRCDAMLQPDPADGSIFIDRDGETFGVVLDFLRGDPPDGPRMQRAIRALSEAAQASVVQELDYFGLETAVFGARPWIEGATFQPGPEMRLARSYYGAVAAGGRAVFFGGESSTVAVDDSNATEIYDTATMAFTAGPDMLMGRTGCTAVQIDADRVLVLGGVDDGVYLDTTEIFNLSTLQLTNGPIMRTGRSLCAAVLLDARRILVVGGADDDDEILSTTEILNLGNMTFSLGPSMATPREGCAVVSLDEDRFLVAGGWNADSDAEDSTEIFDLRTMAFSAGPSMLRKRYQCAAVRVDAGRVLVLGGGSDIFDGALVDGALAGTEVLDIASMVFQPGPVMQFGRRAFTALKLGDERIFVFGGKHQGEDDLASTEVLAAWDSGTRRR